MTPRVRRRATILALLLVFIILLVPTMSTLKNFGRLPDAQDAQRLAASPHYDVQRKIFVNRIPTIMDGMNARTFSMATVREFRSAPADRIPAGSLPVVTPDIAAFLAPSDDVKVIWFGHSTLLLNVQGTTVLVDPMFSESAGPLPFVGKRFQKPVLTLDELPRVDYVVISHDHYDHLDRASVEFFLDKPTHFLVPLGVGSHLKSWGIPAERITELDWWKRHGTETLEFVATPAQHESGRGPLRPNRTFWASWVILGSKHRVFYSGDSGYDTHFKAIGTKYGPFDVAFMETGQYHPRYPEAHLLPADSLRAFLDLNAKRYFPVHWGMFQLNFHPWYEPPQKISEYARERGFTLISPKLGEVVTINDAYVNQLWWNELDDVKRN